jgi:hypothetical protein
MSKIACALLILTMGCYLSSPAIAATPATENENNLCFSLEYCMPDDPVQVANLTASQAPNQLQTRVFPIVSYPRPMTANEKFHYYLKSAYGPKPFALSLADSSINQARNAVPEWGQGWNAFGKRFASSFGKKTVKRTVLFGLKTAFHEDMRFFNSEQSGVLHRSLYAVEQVWIAHKDSGGTRHNYTGIASAFGSAYISRQWLPDSYHKWSDYLSSFVMSLGFDAAKNIFYEFWPDIKQKLHF